MSTYVMRPCITEKTMRESMKGWYTFRVDVSEDKNGVRKEIEKQYNVTVVAIRSGVMPGKSRRTGKKSRLIVGSDWKKIYVKLKTGQTIEAFQIGGPAEEKK